MKSSRQGKGSRRRRAGATALTGARLAAILLVACLSECAPPLAVLPPSARAVAAAADMDAPFDEAARESSGPEHRGYPLWREGDALRPEAYALVAALERADDEGLDPASYDLTQLRGAVGAARGGDPAALDAAEGLLSSAFAAYVGDLHRPSPANRPFLVDAALAPGAPEPEQLLEDAAAAPSFRSYFTAAMRVNPVYHALRRALASERDPERARLIRLNLDRARALPFDPGRRFVLVDAAGARLQLYEDGRLVDEMKVIVGKPGMQTPALAGMIRFASLNPYWNVPPDLVRDKAAKHMLAGDRAYLTRERMQILSDWGDGAAVIGPGAVNWRAVASGAIPLRVRQVPGPDNMMGTVKFMFPNRLGIYLHDTPLKALFAEGDRRRSSGCVRVEDAARLEKWLFGGRVPVPSGAPEQRVDLPEPVPVYILYLTAAPRPDGSIAFQPDGYGRDKVLLASL